MCRPSADQAATTQKEAVAMVTTLGLGLRSPDCIRTDTTAHGLSSAMDKTENDEDDNLRHLTLRIIGCIV